MVRWMEEDLSAKVNPVCGLMCSVKFQNSGLMTTTI